jgi:O-antigen ligase
MAFARGVSRVCATSATFGLKRSGAQRLRVSGHAWSTLAISRPLLGLRRVAAPAAAVGRARVRESRLAGSVWLSVVGAGLLALGGGRTVAEVRDGAVEVPGLASTGFRFVLPAVLIVIGAILSVWGPRLGSALRTSFVSRASRWFGAAVIQGASSGAAAGRVDMSLRRGLRRDPVFLGAVVLALIAGLAGGLSAGSGPVLIVAAGAVVIVAALTLRRPEVFLLVGAVFPWVDWVARDSLGDLGAAWDDAFLLLAIVLLIWAVLVLRRTELWTVPILLPLLLAVVAAIGSVVVNGVPGEVGIFAMRVLFQPLLFYFLGFLFPKNRRWVQWTVALFVLSGVVLALHGVFQYLTHAPMPASWVDVHEGDIATRAYSIIENPNGLGAVLLMGTLITLSLALRPGLRPLQRWAMAAACAVQLAGTAVTFSRGAWLGLGAGVVALLIMSYRRYLVPLVAAGAVGWFVMPAAFTRRLSFALSSTYIAKSMVAGRLYVWRIALFDIAAHPWFGVGLGTFGGTAALTFGYGRLWVDNFYLQLAAEGGLILLALFLWVLLRAAKGLVRAYAVNHDPYMRALTAGVFGGFVAVAAANLTASVWETLAVGVGFWFLTGLASSAALQIPEEVPAEASTGARAGAGAAEERV